MRFGVLFLFLHVAAAARPNIVYLLTDDQDVKLGSLEVQSSVRTLLSEQGLFFNNAFVTTPICCPSRSSILTGKYVHNHHTYENSVSKGCDAPSWRELNENRTIGVYMHRAGYKTGFFGKYLNFYGFHKTGVSIDHIPPGWSRWYTLVGNSKYYNYTVSNNGTAEQHGDNYTEDYFTDVLSRAAVKFIHDSASGAKEDTPFFMYIAPPAPHRPATPAPQYAGRFSGKLAPRTPSFGYHGTDKHWLISKGTHLMNSTIAAVIDELYQLRLETLLSVDDMLSAIVHALEEEELIDNTFIFYHSDHGYHLGQFNLQGEKRQPYDENIRVPLIVRGPGVPRNTSTDALSLNIDLAPTFIDLAGEPIPEDMDGQSFKPALMGKQAEEEGSYQFLLEYFGLAYNGKGETKDGCETNLDDFPMTFLHDCRNDTYLGLRAFNEKEGDFIFVEFFLNDSVPMNTSQIYFHEYYDLTKDNWQLKNEVDILPEKKMKEMEETLLAFHACSGSSCHELRRKKG